MEIANKGRIIHSVIPAFMLAVSVGQIYAFTNFASDIASATQSAQGKVQFAFSLGIFFLGMGAAFFGKIVEKNIKLSTFIGTALFIGGLLTAAAGVSARSLALVHLGYGVLLGLGTGIIYITPVKTMMLWFPDHKAMAAALPIISFGLGSTLSTLLYKGFGFGDMNSIATLRFMGFADWFGASSSPEGLSKSICALAVFYAVPMLAACAMLKKPRVETLSFGRSISALGFRYAQLVKDPFFLKAWLFMFLNISAGLCLIPLAKQMMRSGDVGYSEGVSTAIVALCGLMNGGGRFFFAWWSDRLARRINILLAILSISAGVMALCFWPPAIGLALLVINACYGAGFSVIPAILADRYGMTDISKIHGAVLSAWGVAGLAGNQAAMLVYEKLGGYMAVVAFLAVVYLLNLVNAFSLRSTPVRARNT